MVGLLNWGNPQSGYFGVEEGDYAFQHAEMSLLWQVIGVAVCIGVGMATAWILGTILQRTIGLREEEDVIVEGFDLRQWDVVHDLPDSVAPASGATTSEPAAVAAGRGNGTESTGSTAV
jgi:ammonia channel protein AmtB